MAGYYGVFPLGTSHDVIEDELPKRARQYGLEPEGDIYVNHSTEARATVAYVFGKFMRHTPGQYIGSDAEPRELSTLDRPQLWPARKASSGMLRSGSSGER